jgi:hypothetical protein
LNRSWVFAVLVDVLAAWDYVQCVYDTYSGGIFATLAWYSHKLLVCTH